MSEIKDGGAAFPGLGDEVVSVSYAGGWFMAKTSKGEFYSHDGEKWFPKVDAMRFGLPTAGMSLRDYFAAKAMQTLLLSYDTVIKEHDDKDPRVVMSSIATLSYTQASAMLAAREVKP